MHFAPRSSNCYQPELRSTSVRLFKIERTAGSQVSAARSRIHQMLRALGTYPLQRGKAGDGPGRGHWRAQEASKTTGEMPAEAGANTQHTRRLRKTSSNIYLTILTKFQALASSVEKVAAN